MRYSLLSAALVAESVFAYPFMGAERIPSAAQHKRQATLTWPAVGTCPSNAHHVPAVPLSDKYPYLGAKGTLSPGTGKGGIQVPAPGDVDHYFVAPDFSKDIRGPCPGLNAAANHGFLARDGITTFDELVAAQQNMYNVGPSLAILLAVFGVELDGDTVTGKMSLGCDATPRTALLGAPILGQEPGLNGHNKFEADTSLSRTDYFLGKGDDYSPNTTLFSEMLSYCNGHCGKQELGLYRAQRWQESMLTNANFFFGVGSLLLYGAASFLYELFPGSTHQPDESTIATFFGLQRTEDGSDWEYIGERVPAGWRNRVDPYDLQGVGGQIGGMYQVAPQKFGGNIGVNNFDGEHTDISSGLSTITDGEVTCFLYQQVFGVVPGEVNNVAGIPLKLSDWAVGKLSPIFKNLGCPEPIY